MEADFPPERRFWFEPSFHTGQSALLHKQPDNIWRIDLQLGWDADPRGREAPREHPPAHRRVVGDRPFRLDWASVYTFQCRRLARFVHGRVIFAGDSAHVGLALRRARRQRRHPGRGQSRLEARRVLAGEAPPALLDTYDAERIAAADENIAHSARATRFMSPAPGIERLFRDQVLALASHAPFARAWVNSGRLPRPALRPRRPRPPRACPPPRAPAAPAPDAPAGNGWLLDRLGRGFTLLALNADAACAARHRADRAARRPGRLAERYLDGCPQALYLVRPDQHIAARWVIAPARGHRRASATARWAGRMAELDHRPQPGRARRLLRAPARCPRGSSPRPRATP